MYVQDTVDVILNVHKDKVAASSRCRTKGMRIQGAVDPLCLLEPEVQRESPFLLDLHPIDCFVVLCIVCPVPFFIC